MVRRRRALAPWSPWFVALCGACVQPRLDVPTAGTFGAARPGLLAAAAPAGVQPAPAANEVVEPGVAAEAAARTVALPLRPEAAPADEPPAPPLASDDDERHLERALRLELATAADPAAAALELAGFLAAAERHAEALAALDQAERRSADPALTAARAGVLRDLGRRHLAVAALRELGERHGRSALHPQLLFELAELEWLEGERSAAQATLADVRRLHAADPWLEEHRSELDGLADELARAPRPRSIRLRDLLGNLRGAPSPRERLAVLEQLAATSKATPEQGMARRLHRQAIAIGCADDSPAVRARAVQLAVPDPEVAAMFWREALADPAPLVRRFAGQRAAEQLGTAAVALLAASLQSEEDPLAFAALHQALSAVAAAGEPAPTAATDTPQARQLLRDYWSRWCGQ